MGPVELHYRSQVMKAEFECPDNLSPDVVSLMRSLMTKDVSKRFGCLAAGADDLRKHPWYASVDFDWVRNLIPPDADLLGSDCLVCRRSVQRWR